MECLAEELAGRDVWQPERLGKTLGLGALARSWGTEHDDDAAVALVADCRVRGSHACHLMNPS